MGRWRIEKMIAPVLAWEESRVRNDKVDLRASPCPGSGVLVVYLSAWNVSCRDRG